MFFFRDFVLWRTPSRQLPEMVERKVQFELLAAPAEIDSSCCHHVRKKADFFLSIILSKFLRFFFKAHILWFSCSESRIMMSSESVSNTLKSVSLIESHVHAFKQGWHHITITFVWVSQVAS